MCRIAEVLIALQQAGNVKYTGWKLSFSCKIGSSIKSEPRQMETELLSEARQMETELQSEARTELQSEARHMETELQSEARQMETELQSEAKQIETKLQSQARQMETKLQSLARQMETKLESETRQMETKLQSLARQMETKLESETRQMETKLQSLARQMEADLQKWKDEVKEAREEFYELNYYRTLQLLSLRSELGKLKRLDCVPPVINPTVQVLLHSISPEIATSSIIAAVQDVASVVQNRGPFSQTGASVTSPNSNTNTVLERKMEVDESYSNIATDILASVDTQADISSLPEAPQAKLTKEELSDTQKEIFANLTDYVGIHPPLVLIALEKYKEDRYKIKDWCIENAGSFNFPEDENQTEGLGDQELESDESESEDEHFSNAIGKLLFPYLITIPNF